MARNGALDELRTQAARLREESARFRERMDRARAVLQPQVERARAERAARERESRRAAAGQVDDEGGAMTWQEQGR